MFEETATELRTTRKQFLSADLASEIDITTRIPIYTYAPIVAVY